jgi:hypothetical protein
MSSPSSSAAADPFRSGPSGPFTPPDVLHLVHRRDLRVPPEDHQALADYWAHIRELRAAVEADLLADNEIALTWTAVDPDGR